MKEQEDTRADPNRHVVDYLSYYSDPNSEFDYAVMLRGPWGSGKTYLINRFLTEHSSKTKTRHLYVSLYGLQSFRQIDDAFNRQLHPILSSKGMKIAAAIAKGTFKTAFNIDLDAAGKEDATTSSQIPDLDVLEYFKTPRERLLVFDDLERCSIPISDVLGYINSFVEHEGFKVIILANEADILKNADTRYVLIKEKLIGQTLEVQSTAYAAIDNFFSHIRNAQVRAFLVKSRDQILLIHQQSGTDNLRILKQALWDFERIAACLSPKHWANDEALSILLSVILVLSFHVRAGTLNEDQFSQLRFDRFARMKATSETARTVADDLETRYPELPFDRAPISIPLIGDALFKGSVDRTKIRSSLNQSAFYIDRASEPAWRTAWRGWDLDDDEYEEAVRKVELQFRERVFSIPGEMFHVFGLRLMFSEIGIISASETEVVEECKDYLDDIIKTGLFGGVLNDKLALDSNRSWDGLGFAQANTAGFNDILTYYDSIRTIVITGMLPKIGRELLNLMHTDAQKYFRMLCVNNVEASPYYNIPVLSKIPVNDFVDKICALKPETQRAVLATFKGRYGHGLLGRELTSERTWLANVKTALEKRVPKLRPMSRYRLRNLIGHYVDPFL